MGGHNKGGFIGTSNIIMGVLGNFIIIKCYLTFGACCCKKTQLTLNIVSLSNVKHCKGGWNKTHGYLF
jgi:hypothetical protein